MPPARQPAPPAQQTTGGYDVAVAAAAGALAAPQAMAAIAPAAGAATTALLSAKAITATTGVLVKAMGEFAETAHLDGVDVAVAAIVASHPDVSEPRARALLDQEQKFEAAFRKKMAARLKTDLPVALAITDPKEREDAVRAILEREKRFTQMRQEAMLVRALGKLEARLLEGISPEGAYWKLSPHVKEHTLDCLAMGEKFWPWSVLKKIQPPLHAGCPCYLLGLDEAVQAGLMTRDQVPDPEDAERRYAALKKSVEELEDRDDLQEAIATIFEALGTDRELMQETRLRWRKGFHKGGEFRPERGGSPGLALIRRLIGDGTSPARGRARAGRWAWVRGVYTRIPEQKRWERHVGGVHYHSPPGSTIVYRNGHPISTPWTPTAPAERQHSPGTVRHDPRISDAAESIRGELRRQLPQRRAPVVRGSGPSEVLDLTNRGFRLESAEPRDGGTELHYRSPEGSRLEVVFDGKTVTSVGWNDADSPQPRVSTGDKPPTTWKEFSSDALAWADELGKTHDAEVVLPEIQTANLPDHAGTHDWDGSTAVGEDVRPDIERAGVARKAARALSEDEMRGVWSSYWVTAHEIAHAVNPMDGWDFNGAPANIEEALAEENAHLMAADRLAAQGQFDVLDWRARHPEAPAVQGVYPEQRAALAQTFDDAGVTDQTKRRALLEALAFNTDPLDRLDLLTAMVHARAPDRPLEEVRDEIFKRFDRPIPVPAIARSPGYARLTAGQLSSDGDTLKIPGGGLRRIEKLPLLDGFPELEGMTDGTAIVAYPPGERITSGLDYATGKMKSFRYIDSHDRAKRILNELAAKTAPGVAYEPDPHELEEAASEIAAAKGLVYVGDEVPVKKRFDDSFGVGFPGRDGRSLSGIWGAQNAAKLALWRSDHGATLMPAAASPGTPPTLVEPHVMVSPEAPRTEDNRPWAGEVLLPAFSPGTMDWLPWFNKKKGRGKGQTSIFDTKPAKPPKKEFIGGKTDVPAAGGPIPNYDATRLELGKIAGGSNGARWAFDDAGHRWLVKQYRGNEDRIATELLANRVYAELGAKVADAGTIDIKGKTALTYPTLDGEIRKFTKDGPNAEVGAHFMADALLANWDFAGLSDDNIMWDPEGKPFRVDQGGTFEFRAMGQSKPFGPVPTEVWTMLTKGQAKRASLVDEAGMKEQAADIAKTLTPAEIDRLVDAAPFADEKMRARIRENLKARVAWMDAFAKGDVELPKPLEGAEAAAALDKAQGEFEVYPEEANALSWYTAGGATEVHAALKSGERAPKGSQTAKAISALDAMLRDAKTPEDMKLFVAVDLPLDKLPEDMAGKTMEEKSYIHATTDEAAARAAPGVMKITVPEGSKALYLAGLHALDDALPAEPQVIIARGSRLKLTGFTEVDGRRYLEATLLPPLPAPWTPKKPVTTKIKSDKPWTPHESPLPSGGIWDDVQAMAAGPVTDNASIPQIPWFNTPDKKLRDENVAAANKLRDLALTGNVEGLKAAKLDPKAKKLSHYRSALVAAVTGTKPKPKTTKLPDVKPKPKADASKFDPAVEAKIADAEKALADKHGLVIHDVSGPSRIHSAPWLEVVEAIAKEAEVLEARWPGRLKGIELERGFPKGGLLGGIPNGIYLTANGRIRLRPHPAKGTPGFKNKYGMPWGVSTDVGGVFRHELAHALDWRSEAKYRDALKQTAFKDEDGKPLNTAKWAKRNISEYAGTMTSESIAEAFALFTNPDYKKGRLPARIEQIVEGLISGGPVPEPEIAEIPGGHIV